MIEYITISETRAKLADMKPKSKPIIGGYCKQGIIPSIRGAQKGEWLIEANFIQMAIKWRKTVTTIEDILKNFNTDGINSKQRTQLYKSVSQFWDNASPYALLFSGDYFIPLSETTSAGDILLSLIADFQMMNHSVSLSEAANQLQMSEYQLVQRIKQGQFPANSINNRWYISQLDINKYIDNRGKYISVNDTAIRVAKQTCTLFDPNDRYNIAYLNAYLQASQYRNFIKKDTELGILTENHQSLYFPAQMQDEIETFIEQYFRLYGNRKKLDTIMTKSAFWEDYPTTKEAVQSFSGTTSAANITLLKDILIHTLKHEIMDCNNKDIKDMQAYASTYSKITATKTLVRFVEYVQTNYNCKFTVRLHINSQKQKTNASNTAYSIEDYLKMSYMIFNEEYIRTNELVDKAINDPKHSYIWLYSAMHFVGAWRKGDIDNSLPIITFPYSVNWMIQRIRVYKFSQEAIKISLRLQSEINASNIAPSKTREAQNERFLLIHIPTSLQHIFGVIYAIYCYHVLSGSTFTKTLSFAGFRNFFGEDYQIKFGNRIFQNRRANKSYLDAIAENADENRKTSPSMLGYIVAQFSRAHVKGSESTHRYLSTKMDGYSIDDITVMLFEAGFCSFITNNLLEIVYGEKYNQLTVGEQNALIQTSNLDAYKADKIATLLDTAYHCSKSTITTVFKQYTSHEEKRQIAEEILLNLAEQTAISKIPGISCICAARRLPCAYPSRNCFGCKYGVYETSFFYLALEHIKEQYHLVSQSRTIAEKEKNQKLLENESLPAICEIMHIAHYTYGMDISEFRDELIYLITTKGGTKNVTGDKYEF